MKFSVFISRKAICAELTATTKEGVITELVQSLVQAGDIKEADQADIIKAIMKREELGSTGIGRGVAVPHTKHASVEKLIGTVGVSPAGLDFESLDGQVASSVLFARFSSGSPWRSLASSRKHLATTAR